ncbi:hypothetical protein AB0D97_14035 [Streptomyces roseus]|uniref:hypothetical protein n=1 Tax=Streptomyces roseus TaxID=66430 RepID=UPI0033D8A886
MIVTAAYVAPVGAFAVTCGGGVFQAVEFARDVAAPADVERADPPDDAAYQEIDTADVRPDAATTFAKKPYAWYSTPAVTATRVDVVAVTVPAAVAVKPRDFVPW